MKNKDAENKEDFGEKYDHLDLTESDLDQLLKNIHQKFKFTIVIIGKFLQILRIPFKILLYPLVYLNLLLKPFLKDMFIASLALVFFLAFVPLFTYWVYANDLNDKEKIMNNNDTGIVLLDRNGQPFFTFYEVKKKTFIPIHQIPKDVQLAVIAMEDGEFYQHSGFSIRGIVRSIIEDIKQKDLVSGGSTITQQLVKNSLLHPKKSFLRKYQEITLAYEIERRFSKQDILEMYLNSVYFGEGAFGVEEAVKAYFGKNIKDLSLAEASMLAAILPAPSKLSPISGDFDQAKKRQEIVLNRMVKQQFITEEQRQAALSQELHFQTENGDLNVFAPHFALMVKEALIKEYGEETISRSGFRVRTSLDLEFQKYAEEVVTEQVKNLKNSQVSNGSAVVIDPKNGEVLALVGSQNWFDDNFGKVNITTAPRQPGSAFKPIVYASALEKGLITPATILKDSPITYKNGSGQGSPPYRPVNYDRKFRGQVTARRALANSLNVPSVEVLDKLGIENALEMANRLGLSTLTSPTSYGLSLTLGAAEVELLELTEAYGVFANGGSKNEIATVLEISDKQNNTIFMQRSNPKQVLKPEYAFLISSILSDEKTRAETFGDLLNISRPAAVKTGTSENYKDSLTIGYTPSLVVGVWVGNNDGRPMNTVAGSLGAAPIWKKLMEKYLSGQAVEKFEPPENIDAVTICKQNGLPLRAKEATSSGIIEYFVKGTVPKGNCNLTAPKPSPELPLNSDSSEHLTDKETYQEIRLRNGSLLQLRISGSKKVKVNYDD